MILDFPDTDTEPPDTELDPHGFLNDSEIDMLRRRRASKKRIMVIADMMDNTGRI